MKHFILLFVFLVGSSAYAGQWLHSYKAAQAQSHKNGKPILMMCSMEH